jgi:hypothetical protein
VSLTKIYKYITKEMARKLGKRHRINLKTLFYFHKPMSRKYQTLSFGKIYGTILNICDVNSATVHVIYNNDYDLNYDDNDDKDENYYNDCDDNNDDNDYANKDDYVINRT